MKIMKIIDTDEGVLNYNKLQSSPYRLDMSSQTLESLKMSKELKSTLVDFLLTLHSKCYCFCFS